MLTISVSPPKASSPRQSLPEWLIFPCLAGSFLHASQQSLRIERLCAGFERTECAATKEDIKRIDKQISESGAAQASLDLIRNIAAYKKHIKELFPGGVKNLHEVEAYIVYAKRQIIQLAQCLKGMSTSQEKVFFSARQDNLREGVAAFKKIQKIRCFLHNL
jgi:hypothetical protein